MRVPSAHGNERFSSCDPSWCLKLFDVDFGGRQVSQSAMNACPEATTQDMFKLNKMIRSAKSIESKLKIHSIPIDHLRFMGVHDAAHATVEGGASQQAQVILAVHFYVTDPKSASINPEMEQQEDRESGARQFGC